MGRPARRKSYAYCFRGGAPGKAVILYEYNAMEHKRFVDVWFAGFSGTLHCDADPFFNQLFSDDDVNASFCNAHAAVNLSPFTTTNCPVLRALSVSFSPGWRLITSSFPPDII